MSDRILAWFSCGITSAVACKLAIDMFPGKVDLWYFEIDSAHPDNERFIADCEKWLGQKVNRARSPKYRDQFEVIEKGRYINGPTGAKCTSELKKAVRFEIEKQGFSAQVFGFEFDEKEIGRALSFQDEYPYTNPIFPLIERKLTKNQCAHILAVNKIELPVMYKLGYPNNNCIGCVKGGMGYWNKIRTDFPNEFKRMAEAERSLGHACLKDDDGLVFLDELHPDRGRDSAIVMPDCGVFCEVEFSDLLKPKAKKVLSGDATMRQLSFGFAEAGEKKGKKRRKSA